MDSPGLSPAASFSVPRKRLFLGPDTNDPICAESMWSNCSNLAEKGRWLSWLVCLTLNKECFHVGICWLNLALNLAHVASLQAILPATEPRFRPMSHLSLDLCQEGGEELIARHVRPITSAKNNPKPGPSLRELHSF